LNQDDYGDNNDDYDDGDGDNAENNVDVMMVYPLNRLLRF